MELKRTLVPFYRVQLLSAPLYSSLNRLNRSICTKCNRAFSHAAPRLWNKLPIVLRAEDCHSNYNRQLKTLLCIRTFSL